MADFVKGDKVRHKQMPDFQGTFVKYSRAYRWTTGTRAGKSLRKVYWRFEEFGTMKLDWTWEDVMEPAS